MDAALALHHGGRLTLTWSSASQFVWPPGPPATTIHVLAGVPKQLHFYQFFNVKCVSLQEVHALIMHCGCTLELHSKPFVSTRILFHFAALVV